MKGIVKYLVYAGAGLFFFIFFLFWTFPYDVLKTQMIHQIEDGLGGQYRIKVQKMSAGLITGFTFKNVEVVKKDAGRDVLMFKSPKLKINPSLLALLSKKTVASYSIVAGKGEVDGKIIDSADETRVIANLDELNLNELKFLSVSYGVNLKGIVDGDIDLKFSKKDPTKNSGKIELNLISWVLDPMKIKMDPQAPEATMDLPKITLTGAKNSKLTGDLVKNDLNIKDLSLKGGDIDLNMKGKLTITPKVDDYQLNLDGKFKLTPALTQAIPMLALFEQQKQADGSYDLQLSGRFVKPSITVGRFKLPF